MLVTEIQLFLESRVALNFRFLQAGLLLQLWSSDTDVTAHRPVIAIQAFAQRLSSVCAGRKGRLDTVCLSPSPGIGNAIK